MHEINILLRFVTMKVNIKFQDIFSELYEFQHCGF